MNSDVREHIIHVGAEADLSVGVPATLTDGTDTPIDPGDKVDITVTASNAGPETAPDAKVDVDLSDGLTYSSHNTVTGNYDSASGVWTIGELAKDVSKTLTITATVAPGTLGTEQKVKATISATEPVEITESEDGKEKVKRYDLPVVDPGPGENMSMVTIVVVTRPNVDPIFRVEATVAENSPGGTAVYGSPLIRDPDDTTHTFRLEGEGKGHFHVNPSTGIVTVDQGANLNYECKKPTT